MSKTKDLHILFGATSDFLSHAIVTAVSAIEHTDASTEVHIHFMYADIVKPVSDKMRTNWFERAENTIAQYPNAHIHFYDVADKMHVFDKQNIGLWGKEISMTHYIYLLAPQILHIPKVIYLDTDMIVNCDLMDVFNTDMKETLIGMGAPRGFEEMGDDVSNSGFVVLNLAQWRKQRTLQTLLEFGEKLPRGNFCDQNLLYQYFTKKHPDELMLFDKEYNIFPQLFPEMPATQIKIMHFTGWESTKPWLDVHNKQRLGDLWWYYARKTAFYESLLFSALEKATFSRMAEVARNNVRPALKITRKRKFYKFMSQITIGKTHKKFKEKCKKLPRY